MPAASGWDTIIGARRGRGPLAVLTGLALGLAACGPAGVRAWTPPTDHDTKDDPGVVRPGYGNAELHTWYPLTAPELAAVHGVDLAKRGDAHALLALAIFASGDKRDDASYAAYQKRVDDFVSQIRPTIEKADDWHKGYELNRAMHRVFFTGTKHGDLGSYELQQNRLTGIFDRGNYNCISSAMLYAVLARSFDLPVRGVVVPTHAFIELGVPGAKILEVETTTDTGFDWVHDAKFYDTASAKWAADRGLPAVTLADYKARTILEPYALMANGMVDELGRAEQAKRAADVEAGRLVEISTILDPDNEDGALDRTYYYSLDAHDLFDKKASRTTAKMFDMLGPAVTELSAKWAKNPKIMGNLASIRFYFANALGIVGRVDEAVAIADDMLDHLDPAWKDAEQLRGNFLMTVEDVMLAHIRKREYAAALVAIDKRFDLCKADKVCADNLAVLYGNWSIEYQNQGDWQAARQKLQACVATLPGNAECADALKELESRHQF